MNEQLKEYIETVIIPQYESFDKAHNLMHVNTVIAESMELAKGYPVDVNMVYTIAAYHDTGPVSYTHLDVYKRQPERR